MRSILIHLPLLLPSLNQMLRSHWTYCHVPMTRLNQEVSGLDWRPGAFLSRRSSARASPSHGTASSCSTRTISRDLIKQLADILRRAYSITKPTRSGLVFSSAMILATASWSRARFPRSTAPPSARLWWWRSCPASAPEPHPRATFSARRSTWLGWGHDPRRVPRQPRRCVGASARRVPGRDGVRSGPPVAAIQLDVSALDVARSDAQRCRAPYARCMYRTSKSACSTGAR